MLYIWVIVLVSGCAYTRSSAHAALDEAERLLLSDPGAAMDRLNCYDVTEFADSAHMARWALLYSEAMVANRLTAPTDTIINIAIDYYTGHNLAEESRRASRLRALLLAGGNRDELATALYLQKEKEYMLYQERADRQLYMSLAVIVVLLAAGVILWQRQRLRLRTAENEMLMSEASALRDVLSQKQSDCCGLESKLRAALESRFETIDSLCQTYYESQGTKAERNAIIGSVKSQIESLKSDEGLFAEMERGVDACRDGLAADIRREWPAIKPDDYRLAIYMLSGLSNRTIALLLGESMDVVYKRKSRLKARLGRYSAISGRF